MTDYADLEIELHRGVAGYTVDLRFNDPESDGEIRPLKNGPVAVALDPPALLALAGDVAAYGRKLGEQLFVSSEALAGFGQARAVTDAAGKLLRVRLAIDSAAAELGGLLWETLIVPGDARALASHERTILSRYLASPDWRTVRPVAQADWRALVVVASPSDLADYSLAALDYQSETAAVSAAVGSIPQTVLAAPGAATVDALLAQLRTGVELLYLIAHGALIDGTPHLWLEDEAGKANVVSGDELVALLSGLAAAPRLVVLASCQSAGAGHNPDAGAARAALGPRLAAAGVPAVIAMQSEISIETVGRLMPAFFSELRRDGRIDRALAVARTAIREEPDWWVPVLLLRLKSGALWYKPGFAEEKSSLEKWDALLASMREGRCTPIIGPGLPELVFGAQRDLARQWAERYHFPLAPHDVEDIAQVAQYLSVNQSVSYLRTLLGDMLRSKALAGLGSDELKQKPLRELLTALAIQRSSAPGFDPYRALAALRLPIYISADPTPLLVEALRAEGVDPVVEICRWNEKLAARPSIFETDRAYYPSPERPYILQVFGAVEEPRSLVLTEDDYFDYLIGNSRNRDLVPGAVRRAIVDSGLLFVGFRLDEFSFRVLFRSIISQEGSALLDDYAHIAAQLNPEEGRIREPERARKYLESYFQNAARITIYWGSVEDFLQELDRRRRAGG
jgi:hypothetical protein